MVAGQPSTDLFPEPDENVEAQKKCGFALRSAIGQNAARLNIPMGAHG
jgi:hypothetical protein